MGAPADRLNRVLIALLGLLLLAGGVLALVRSFGGFGARLIDDRLLTEGQTRFAERNAWFWIAVAAVASAASAAAASVTSTIVLLPRPFMQPPRSRSRPRAWQASLGKRREFPVGARPAPAGRRP